MATKDEISILNAEVVRGVRQIAKGIKESHRTAEIVIQRLYLIPKLSEDEAQELRTELTLKEQEHKVISSQASSLYNEIRKIKDRLANRVSSEDYTRAAYMVQSVKEFISSWLLEQIQSGNNDIVTDTYVHITEQFIDAYMNGWRPVIRGKPQKETK